MAGPWEQFAQPAQEEPGPWAKFQPTPAANGEDDIVTLDTVTVRPPLGGDAPDYSSVFADPVDDPSSLGKIGLRALVGRVPDLIANAIELPANANEALTRSLGMTPDEGGVFGTMRGLLRSGAEKVRDLGYTEEMDAVGYGVPSVSGGSLVEALNPKANENRARAAEEFGEPGNFKKLTLGDRAATVGKFIPETLVASLPDMAATLNPATLAAYIGSRTNEVAKERAANDPDRETTLSSLITGEQGEATPRPVSMTDLGIAAPSAVLESLLERFTTMRLLPKGTTITTPGVLPAMGRIAKELGIQSSLGGVEELAPYLASTVGTDTGSTLQGALETFAGGAVAEGGLGAGVQTVKEGANALRRPAAPAPLGTAPAAPVAADDVPVAPVVAPLGGESPAPASALPPQVEAILQQLPPDVVDAALGALGEPVEAAEATPAPAAPAQPETPVVDADAPYRRPAPAEPVEAAAAVAEDADVVAAEDIGAALQARVEAAPAEVAQEYDALPDSEGGRVLNTDLARELSPEYREDRTRSADVHEPASAFIKRRYAEKLAAPTPEGMSRKVLFTAGGTGAGKSTAIRAAGDAFGNPEIVYDTNMNTLASAEQKVEQALAAGRDVDIVYVYRDPVEALTGGAIPRAVRMAANRGTGRTVPLEEHAKTHAGVRGVMEALSQKYQGDDRVRIRAIDNSQGLGNSRMVDLAALPEVEENSLRERLSAALEEARSGGLDEALYRGFSAEGRQVDSGPGRGSRRAGDGRQPQPERAQEQLAPPADGSEAVDDSTTTDTDEAAPAGAASRPESALRREPTKGANRTPIGVDDMRRALTRITDQWKGDRPVVRYLQDARELPAEAKRLDGWSTAEGWYDGGGAIYLIASNIPNLTRAEQVLAHEAIGHYGVEGVVGKDAWARVLADVERLKRNRADLRGDLKAALASTDRRYGNESAPVYARELLAVMAEKNIKASVIDRVLAAVRAWLKRFGFNADNWTESSLRSVLAEGARRVEQGGKSTDREGVAGFSRPATDMDTPTKTDKPAEFRDTRGEPDDVRHADSGPRERGPIDRAAQDVRDQLESLRGAFSGKPKNPESIARRLNDTRSAIFDSIISRARDLEARNKQSKALPKLFNLAMAAPGDSRLVLETVNDAIHSRFATFTNRVRNILGNNGLERMTPIENAQLRATMLGTEKNVPANIKLAGEQLRKLMDVQREDMLAAGIDVGEVEDIGYLTRIYDEAKILDDRKGFLKAAAELYEKHEFAREVGKTASETMYGEGTLATFLGYAKRAATTDPKVEDALNKIKAALKSYRFSSNVNNETQEIQKQIARIHALVARDYGLMRSSAWLHGINTPDVTHFASGLSPSGAPITKGRELSGAADIVMAPYLKTDMLDILDTYSRTAAKKIEHAKRFGADGSQVQALIDQASSEGVPKGDMEQAITLLDSVLGLNAKQPESKLKSAADFIHAWSYLALLGRATFSSLAEAVTFALRTGNLVHTVAPLIQVQRAITRSRKGKALNELAQVIAVNGHKAVEDVLMNRLGGDYAMTPRWSALLHRFFYATLLTPITRAQRAYGVGAATGFLRSLARDVKAGKEKVDTAALLNEVGIADHEAFAEWMLAQGTLPDTRTLFDQNGRPTPRGQDYMVAVRRIIDQAIQNPGAEHRPAWTNNPSGRLVTGIMSFAYASYENIIKREAALMARNLKDEGRVKAAKRSAHAVTAAAALVLAQTITSTVRELLFNWDRFEDKDDEEIAKELAALGLSRTFGLGSADPIINYLTGLKYQRGLAEIAMGAGPGLFAQALDRGGTLLTDRNSPSTETAEYRFAQSVYGVAIAPALNVILSRIPFVGGPAIMASSGPNARNWFAEQFTKKPEGTSHLDKKYQEASKDLDEVLDVVNDRIAALPEEQWQDELDKLKTEYPSILAGVTLDVYADNAANRNKGRVGKPKTAGHEGKPGLKLQGSEKTGEGSVLGELEGYQHYDPFKKRYVSEEGIRDNISALNKALKNLRSDSDVTIADLMAFARKAPSVKPIMDEYWTEDPAKAEKPAGTRLVNQVIDELLELRRAEKKRALEIIEKGQRGEPIQRGGADAVQRRQPDATRGEYFGVNKNSRLTPIPDVVPGAKNAPKLVMVGDYSGLENDQVREALDNGADGVFDPASKTVYVAMGMDPAYTKFVAYHEIAGHYGLQGAMGDDYEKVMNRALQNPTVDKLSRAMGADAYSFEKNRLALTEEALAELAAAVRSGDFSMVERERGVKIPASVRPGVRGMLGRVVQMTKRKLADLTGEEPDAYDDDQVYSLIEDAWQYVEKGDRKR